MRSLIPGRSIGLVDRNMFDRLRLRAGRGGHKPARAFYPDVRRIGEQPDGQVLASGVGVALLFVALLWLVFSLAAMAWYTLG